MRRNVGTQWGMLCHPIDMISHTSIGRKKDTNYCSGQMFVQYFSKIVALYKYKYDHPH